MSVIAAQPRITVAGVAAVFVLGLGLAAAADLGFTALAVLLSVVNPRIGLIGDAGVVLSYFTFYPCVLVAAITMVIGALFARRVPRAKRIGRATVAAGVLSASFVLIALLPQALR